MASGAAAFQRELGARLAETLGGYQFLRTHAELRKASEAGWNSLFIQGASRSSPFVSINFGFGCRYAAAARLEKALGIEPAREHIAQNSLNRAHMKGLPMGGPGKGSWSLDIRQAIDANLLGELARAVEHTAQPFFARFATPLAARDALSAGDPWCFGGAMAWRHVLVLDALLGDLDHFRNWSRRLGPLDLAQAEPLLARAEAVLATQA